jgi:hypothetical protein
MMGGSGGGFISRAGSKRDESVVMLLSIPLAPMNARCRASLARSRFLSRSKLGTGELDSLQDDHRYWLKRRRSLSSGWSVKSGGQG